MTPLILFASTFITVFALGLQSLNVNGGHRVMAMTTSLAIGAGNLVLFKVLPGPTTLLDIAGFLSGGPLGIVSAMAAHPLLVRWYARLRDDKPLPTIDVRMLDEGGAR